jgi:hypothetical protein
MCKDLRKVIARTKGVKPSAHGCEECLATGSAWVHLRLCLTCGHVGCCDDSPNRHATRHYERTDHPVVRSFEPGEGWGWCFADEELAEEVPAFPGEAAPHHYSAGAGLT